MVSWWHPDMAYLSSFCFISVLKKIILRVCDKALFYLITSCKRSLGQGNAFTRVTGGLPPGDLCLRVAVCFQGVCIQGMGWQTPPRTRKAAGMHPTGILSCWRMFLPNDCRNDYDKGQNVWRDYHFCVVAYFWKTQFVGISKHLASRQIRTTT